MDTSKVDKQLLAELTKKLCGLFGITVAELYIPNRRQHIKICRWMIWKIMWAKCELTLGETAAIFGSYDHSSVSHAFDVLPVVISKDPVLAERWQIATGGEDMNELRWRSFGNSIAKKSYINKIYKYRLAANRIKNGKQEGTHK